MHSVLASHNFQGLSTFIFHKKTVPNVNVVKFYINIFYKQNWEQPDKVLAMQLLSPVNIFSYNVLSCMNVRDQTQNKYCNMAMDSTSQASNEI